MSNPDSSVELTIARWSDRFIAWLIDFLIISSISLIIFASWHGTSGFEWNETMMYSRGIDYLPGSVLFFVYWVILEYKTGQTIGKKILNLKVVTIDGKKPPLFSIAINVFGKAFLLPLDVLLGLILTNQKRQRIFNKISNVIIIKIKENEKEPENIEYKMD